MTHRAGGGFATTVVLVAAVVLTLSACGSSGPVAGTSTPTPAPPASARPIDPNFDQGQLVLITAQGFHPKWLVALDNKAIMFRNQSGVPQTVVFDHQDVRSQLIAPGGEFSFTPHNVMSMTYHSGLHPNMTGVVQVNEVLGSPVP